MAGHRSVFDSRLGFSPLVCLFALGTWFVTLSSLIHGEDLPRYKLKVGQELIYRSNDPPKEYDVAGGEKTTVSVIDEWTLYVVRENNDGSFRLMFRAQLDQTSSFMVKGERKERRRTTSADGYFDLWPDGRMTENKTSRPGADPTVLFPKLPPDLSSMRESWEATVSVDDAHSSLRPAANDSPVEGVAWHFVEDRALPFDAIYLMSRHHDYLFDCDLGLTQKVTTVLKTAWPPSREDKPEIQSFAFAATRQLDSTNLRALGEESDCYWAAMEDYGELVDRARKDVAHAAEWFDKGELRLKQLVDKFTLSSVRMMLDRKLKQHQWDRSYKLPQYQLAAAVINKPSPDWHTTDLAGTPRSLADYRGKVVVLDFWNRGCGWCIRAMPQIKKLADDFRDREVAILGVNNDKDERDARFVIDGMKLNYETLKELQGEEPIFTKYRLVTWPSTIIIDPQGTVRQVYLGYSPTLRHDLGEIIRDLLTEKQE